MVPDSSSRRSAIFSLLRFVHDRNPFYLFSALSLFIGFRVILGAMDSRPGDWKTLLDLIVTLNCYEVVTIALALFLIVRRGLVRDGWILLAIEALFLVDLTNLNAELFTAMPRLGSAVNGICFLLAMTKILIIIGGLGLRISPGSVIYIAAQLLFLFGLPGIFRLMRSSTATISPMQIYGIWWAAGLLIAGGILLAKQNRAHDASPMAPLPFRLYILLPVISLLVHLASENRVYWIHFQPANLAPILLAGGFGLNRSKWRLHPNTVFTTLALVGAAIAVSIIPDEYRLDLLTRWSHLDITPMRIALLGSGILLAYLSVVNRSLVYAKAAAVGYIVAKIAADPEGMRERFLNFLEWCYQQLFRVIPQTEMEWGLAAIASAFLLLGFGALISLTKNAPVALEANTTTE